MSGPLNDPIPRVDLDTVLHPEPDRPTKVVQVTTTESAQPDGSVDVQRTYILLGRRPGERKPGTYSVTDRTLASMLRAAGRDTLFGQEER